jgi:hypothetical protein
MIKVRTDMRVHGRKPVTAVLIQSSSRPGQTNTLCAKLVQPLNSSGVTQSSLRSSRPHFARGEGKQEAGAHYRVTVQRDHRGIHAQTRVSKVDRRLSRGNDRGRQSRGGASRALEDKSFCRPHAGE